MKTRKIGLIITGILMIIASLTAAVTAVLIFISRFSAVGTSVMLSFISCALIFVWAILNIYIAFTSLFGGKKSKRFKKCFVLGIISIILFTGQCFVSAFNGIVLTHLLILAVCGFVIPCFQLFVCRCRM